MPPKHPALSPQEVYVKTHLSPRQLASLPAERLIIGQERALEAIRFGARMRAAGYNIFCTGPKGVGRTSLSLDAVRALARSEKTPGDWCFIHNFETPHRPLALALPAGQGKAFAADIKRLAESMRLALGNVFANEAYQIQLAHIAQRSQQEKEAYFEVLQTIVETPAVALTRLPTGLAVAPRYRGKVLEAPAFNKLPKAARKSVLEQMKAAQERLEKAIQKTPAWDTLLEKEKAALNADTVTHLAAALARPLRKRYEAFPMVQTFLDGICQSLRENSALFSPGSSLPSDARERQLAALFSRYAVNLLVAREPDSGAPVIHVNHPTLSNLLGKIERVQCAGSLVTDFSLIRAGALHWANGGYIVIEAHDLLDNAPTWNALKRCLFSKTIKMESGIDDNSIFGVISQDPLPIPLDVKVILIGEPSLYHALAGRDDEFAELFKVQSHFAEKMERTPAAERAYARVLLNFARAEKLRPFAAPAVCRLIEHAARLAEDQRRLSTYLVHVNDLMREAHFLAQGERAVAAEHIEQALAARRERLSSYRRELFLAIGRDMIAIETSGFRVGQINALLTHELAAFSFGRPSRITCRVRLGRGDIVDIEREIALGGPIHTKGVLILSAFLGGRFGQTQPLALDASLVFEQLHGEVDGDSAAATELCCLLSAIADVPLDQGLAVTGAVNQLGEIQAIGGLNEKIEGYFAVCRERGLTGTQGVIIPAISAQTLMLSAEVAAAIAQKRFHIYPARHIDAAMEMLTGLPAGAPDKRGAYPPRSLNGRIQGRLAAAFKRAQKMPCGAPAPQRMPTPAGTKPALRF